MAHEKHKKDHIREVIYRLVDLFALLVVAILICALFDRQLMTFASDLEKIFDNWNTWVYVAVALMFSALLWYVLIRLGGACFSGFFTNPPVWIVGIITFIFYYLFKLYLFKGGEDHKTDAVVITIVIFTIIGIIIQRANLILCGYIEGKRSRKAQTDLDINAPVFDRVIKDPNMLIEWIQKEEPIERPSQDYFEMNVFAQRIADILKRTPLKTIGLVGRYGSGKSSILNMVKSYIESSNKLERDIKETHSSDFYPSRDIIICKVSGWGFQEGTAAQYVLQKAVKQLETHTDCLSITTLPSRYGRAIGDSGNVIARIIGTILCGWQSPIDILRKLDLLLYRIEKRMVIFLEDIDRNTRPEVFFNEISALLEGLKGLKNVTFVLAIGEEHSGKEVLIKTSEHIETIPKLSRREVIKMCGTFRTHCLSMLDDHCKCITDEKRDERMGMGRSDIVESIVDIEEMLEKPIDIIASLLISPRVAKATLRRTWQAWQTLCGEIDFDDLFMVNVLRTGAPEAFIFVNEKIELMRSFASTSDTSEAKERKDKNREKLHAEFTKVTEEVEWDFEAAKKLINDLFPGWYAAGRLWDVTLAARLENFQHVTNSEPTDYWNRLMREKLSPDEIRDQEVINALVKWKQKKGTKVYKGLNLPQVIFEVENFADKVEQFGMLLDGNEVRCIAGGLFKLILAGRKVTVKASQYIGFTQLWRLSLKKPIDSHDNWIIEEIKKALKVSLRFANDLYYYYRHQELSAASADVPTPELRSRFFDAAKETYANNPDLLIEAIDPNSFVEIYNFAVYSCSLDAESEGFDNKDWKWLADMLLKAGEKNPKTVVPQIAALVVERKEQFKSGRWECNLNFNNDRCLKLFGDNVGVLMNILVKEVDTSGLGEQGKATVEYARMKAKQWLDEQGNK